MFRKISDVEQCLQDVQSPSGINPLELRSHAFSSHRFSCIGKSGHIRRKQSKDSAYCTFSLQRGNGRTPLEQVAWGVVMSLPSTSQGVLDKQLAVQWKILLRSNPTKAMFFHEDATARS
jgi:hypothetical protein